MCTSPCVQAGTDLNQILHDKSFPEPRLTITQGDSCQGFIVCERELLMEVKDFCVVDGLITLMAIYYTFHVNYPTAKVAAGVLLFLQEGILGRKESTVSKPSRYRSLMNSIML